MAYFQAGSSENKAIGAKLGEVKGKKPGRLEMAIGSGAGLPKREQGGGICGSLL